MQILGVDIDCIDKQRLIQTVMDWCSHPKQDDPPRNVFYVNAHCLNTAQNDPEYADILNKANLVYSDGIGIVLAWRILSGTRTYKVTGRDWINDLCHAVVEKDLCIYILAGKPGIARIAADHLVTQVPGLKVAGVCDGYFVEKSEQRVLNEINSLHPDILFVGMGVPQQEKWIENKRMQFDASVCWGVGALFDYLAGVERVVPAWMNRLALEWLWRLAIDPRGKWRRYLIGNPIFIVRVLIQKFLTG